MPSLCLSDEDMGATSHYELSVEEVDDVMSDPESGTPNNVDAPHDMIVDSAPSNPDDVRTS